MDKMIYSILSIKKNPGKLNDLLLGIKGISGGNLYLVSADDITALVSNIKGKDLIANRSNAIEYAGVIETLAQQFTLLPVRFGSVMESNDAIKKMLERNYNEIQHNLMYIENKVEFGLKVFCDSEKIKAELKAKKEYGPIIEVTLGNGNSIYRDYLNKKIEEHRVEELLLSHIDKIIKGIIANLVQLNPIHKFKKMTTTTNIIDAVFLLEKDKKDNLVNAIKGFQNQYTDLHFVLTGPWPPYSFVDIPLK
jgi:hypothetical protein